MLKPVSIHGLFFREVEAYEEGFKERLKHRLQNFVNWFKTSSGKAQPESSEDEGERKKR